VSTEQRAQQQRRRGDRRTGYDRRRMRAEHGWFQPEWGDQRLQFITRYLFTFLGVVYFNFVFEYGSPWMNLAEMNAFLLGYAVWVTAVFIHARQRPFSPSRFRAAMWGDIFGVSVAVLNDPFVVPLSSMVYIVIVLGNGMRYGMRCFSEVLVASFLAAMFTLTIRYSAAFHSLSPGVLFLNIFGAIILVYAYVLMGRVEALRRRFEESSKIDPLTGLPNRAALLEAAEAMLGPARQGTGKLTVMFADLDKFKVINDTLGHGEGDRVLRAVADILSKSVRRDDVVARYGGDEFVMLLGDVQLDEAEVVAQRLQAGINLWARQNGLDLSVTFGMGEAPAHGTDLATLLAIVDRALYQSKAEHGAGGLCRAV
jgi:diguanylate cyclase (GGDEF)-like protein